VSIQAHLRPDGMGGQRRVGRNVEMLRIGGPHRRLGFLGVRRWALGVDA
jgi:hypothetical protein